MEEEREREKFVGKRERAREKELGKVRVGDWGNSSPLYIFLETNINFYF